MKLLELICLLEDNPYLKRDYQYIKSNAHEQETVTYNPNSEVSVWVNDDVLYHILKLCLLIIDRNCYLYLHHALGHYKYKISDIKELVVEIRG